MLKALLRHTECGTIEEAAYKASPGLGGGLLACIYRLCGNDQVANNMPLGEVGWKTRGCTGLLNGRVNSRHVL